MSLLSDPLIQLPSLSVILFGLHFIFFTAQAFLWNLLVYLYVVCLPLQTPNSNETRSLSACSPWHHQTSGRHIRGAQPTSVERMNESTSLILWLVLCPVLGDGGG